MLALLKTYVIELADLKHVANQKMAEKGGFEARIYNAFVEINADNSNLGYYKSRPNKYPELKFIFFRTCCYYVSFYKISKKNISILYI